MEQHLIPFGAGPRVCGGQNLAQIVLRIAIATILSNFDIVARAAETNERTMEIRDAFVSLVDERFRLLCLTILFRSCFPSQRSADSLSSFANSLGSSHDPQLSCFSF